MPGGAAGFVVHQAIIAPRRQRIKLRNVTVTLGGAILAFIPLGVLLALIPDLYFRARDLSAPNPSVIFYLQRLLSTFDLYFLHGHHLWQLNYNTPESPMLPPVSAILAVIGLALALWSWRKAEGALLIGGLLAFSLPSALSPDKTAFRAIGALPLLALLSGWAVCWLMSRLTGLFARLQNAARWSYSRWQPVAGYAGQSIVIVAI